MRRAESICCRLFLIGLLAAAYPSNGSAADSGKSADDKKSQEALNKIDVGFFLLLDKKHPDAEAQKALNKIDVGFFLLLDKKQTPPAKEVDLGRELFFDPRLSANKVMSCSTCHNPSLAWTDGLPRARGLDGQVLQRNTPTLLNVHDYQQRFFWDGRAATLEDAILTAIQSRLEMDRDLKSLVVDLNRVPDYSRQFVELYGLSGITPRNIAKALAVFVRDEIQPGQTAFDRFRTDRTAMTPTQIRGLELFTGKARCIKCHTGPDFTDAAFHNTGLKPIPGVEDVGRYAVNPVPDAWRAYRTAALRDVALTAPYMHDGSLATLRDVVEFYNRGGDVKDGQDPLIRPLGLSEQEKADLVSFLDALTAPQKPVTAPVLPRETGPASAAQAFTWDSQRLKMIAYDFRSKDLAGVYANAAAIRDNARYLSQAGAGPCADALLRDSWSLSHAADSGASWNDLQRLTGVLKSDNDACVSGGAGAFERTASASPSDAGLKTLCARTFTMDGLMAEIASGRLAESDRQRIESGIIEDASSYYEYRAFASQDPDVCAKLKGLNKTNFGITRTAEWGCREWYYDLATAQGMMTRSPDIEQRCRRSHHHDYPDVPLQDGEAICGIIARNLDHPAVLCGKLIPTFMGPENLQACENEFKRYSSASYIGVTQEGAPDMMYGRYAALDGYAKAYRAKDIALCGDSETCRVLMGQGDALAPAHARKVEDAVCGAPDTRQASAGAYHASALTAQTPSSSSAQ